ncbi:MAG: hypothetical protein R2941_21265 [Desulfobacterales bacterium]
MDQIWGDPQESAKIKYELFHLHGDPSMRMWDFALYASASAESRPGSSTFVIYNDGNADLKITGLSKKYNRSWLSFHPKHTFTLSPGRSATVTVTVDWSKTGAGVNDEQILIYSNDADKVLRLFLSLPATGRKECALRSGNNWQRMVRINGELFNLPTEAGFAKRRIRYHHGSRFGRGDGSLKGWERRTGHQ